MKKSDFIKLHMDLRIMLPKSKETNNVKSATDPTQDIPIRAIEVTAMGIPINVKEFKAVYNNLKPDNFTTIEKRNNDHFDRFGELQESVSKVSRKGVQTNFINTKKQKKHEV